MELAKQYDEYVHDKDRTPPQHQSDGYNVTMSQHLSAAGQEQEHIGLPRGGPAALPPAGVAWDCMQSE